jgi:hypothetical protein
VEEFKGAGKSEERDFTQRAQRHRGHREELGKSEGAQIEGQRRGLGAFLLGNAKINA